MYVGQREAFNSLHVSLLCSAYDNHLWGGKEGTGRSKPNGIPPPGGPIASGTISPGTCQLAGKGEKKFVAGLD